jgi:hypothetical protein
MQSKFVCIFQPSLAIKDKLTSFILLRPKPPNALRRHKESHDFRVRFLVFFGENPHQKFLKALSRLLHKLEGRTKELMA